MHKKPSGGPESALHHVGELNYSVIKSSGYFCERKKRKNRRAKRKKGERKRKIHRDRKR